MHGDLEPGTMVDERYRVLSRIGTGGMADVYLCEDLQLGRQVALKLLHGRFARDGEFVERFRREASSAASLAHPNVVSVFDRGEWNGTYYIAMEHLGGRSLKEIVQSNGPIEPLAAIDLALQLLRATRFAHDHGVIHRDLKPQNAIVDDEGQVKVTDFGIARAGTSEITQTGSIMGTAQYLSPEQAQGAPVVEASDLYSIGIVLYELLSGTVPFDGDSPVTIALKQISEYAGPPSRLNPAVSHELDTIVMRALEKDPALRFANAQEFIDELEAERARLEGKLAPPPVAPAPEIAPLRPERPLWPVLLGGALLLALLIAAVLALSGGGARSVPSVVGRTEAQATQILQRAGYTALSAQVNGTVQAGQVVAQSPRAGTDASRGTLVRISVSAGPGTLQVPDVRGLPAQTARATLMRAGFTVTQTRVPDGTVPAGRVVGSAPAAFTTAAPGSAVALQVSSGAGSVAVPSVVGQSQADATAALTSAGLRVATKSRPSTQQPGTVLAQSPSTRAKAGSVVTLTIAAAATATSTATAVPRLVGRAQVDAISALAAAGLQSSSKSRTVSAPAKDGVVLSQSPAAGASVSRGATVSLVVGHVRPGTQTTTTTTTPAPTTTQSTTTTGTTK